MGGNLLYDFGGLVTAPGLLSRNPASCVDCLNVSFPAPGVMRKRRGFVFEVYDITAIPYEPGYCIIAMATSPELLAVQSCIVVISNGSLSKFYSMDMSIGQWTNIPLPSGVAVASGPGSLIPKMAALAGCEYFSGNRVVRTRPLAGYSNIGGMPRGLAPLVYSMNPVSLAVLSPLAGEWLAEGYNVAYRVTWHKKEGDYEIGGAPSSRLVVRAIAGTSGYAGGNPFFTNLRIPLPHQLDADVIVTAEYFWRLWRSHQSLTDTADDEMYLVDEAYVTAADITAGYAYVQDHTPDVLLQASPRLHTNSSNFPPAGASLVSGQTASWDPPPGCRDIAVYKDCMFYAAPTFRAFQSYRMFALPTAGQTITVTCNGHSVVLTCVAGAPGATNQYTLVNGLATLSLNIEATTRNMVDAFVLSTSGATVNFVSAMYQSQGSQAPGIMSFEGSYSMTFTAGTTAAGAIFRPIIPTTGTTVGSVTKTNVVCFSVVGSPDAVPPVNQLTIGSSGSTILRIIPFRERLVCFTDAGVYEINGSGYDYSVSLADGTVHLLSPNSVVVCEDRLYAWAQEGIVEISDGGKLIISQSIEPTIAAIRFNDYTEFAYRWAIADAKNHRVLFFYGTKAVTGGLNWGETNKWLEWDTRNRKWSKGQFAGTSAIACGMTSTASASNGVIVSDSMRIAYAGTTNFAVTVAADDAWQSYNDADVVALNTVITPISSSATFQFQVPEIEARQHWQELLFEFENGEQSFFSKPSIVNVQWETDTTAISSAVPVTLSSSLVRFETPGLYRRSTRQRVTLTHALNENMGLIAAKQFFADTSKSRFPK